MALRKIKLTVGNQTIGEAITWSYPHSDNKTYTIPTYSLTVEGRDDAGRSQRKSFEVFRFGVQRPRTNAAARVVGLADQQTHTIKKWFPDYRVHSAPSQEDGAWQVYGDFLIHDGPDDPLRENYASIGCVEVCGGPRGFEQFNNLLISLSGSAKPSRAEKLAEIGSSGIMTITYLKAARPPLTVRRNP